MNSYLIIKRLREFQILIKECAREQEWDYAMNEMTQSLNDKFGQALSIISEVLVDLESIDNTNPRMKGK